jgi:arsenate reductase-like glutaredoxin family protein
MPPVQGYNQPSVDPYAFLNETRKPKKFSFGSFNGLSTQGKLIALGVGLVVLIVLLLILKSVFGSSQSVNMPSLYAVLGQEQELINLSTTGSQQPSASQSYLNFSQTVVASVSSDQNNLLTLLSSNGIKVSSSNYLLQPTADAKLTQAIQDSNFDPVYSSVMNTELKLYQADLSNAYSLTKSKVLRSYFKTDYNHTVLLFKMLGSSYG